MEPAREEEERMEIKAGDFVEVVAGPGAGSKGRVREIQQITPALPNQMALVRMAGAEGTGWFDVAHLRALPKRLNR